MDKNEHLQESILMDDTHKFLPENNSVHKQKIQFNGLSKDEVMMCANDPKWVRLRWAVLVLFWVVWFGMLFAAGVIVYVTPSCPFIPKQPWYEKELVYQVDVPSFKDSNGDGIGDLKGLIDNLGYIKEEVGAKTICIGSSFLSENSVKEVDLKQADQASLNEFRKTLRSNDMHLIIDIPYGRVYKQNGSTASVEHWLSFADGVRITDLPTEPENKLLNEWVNLADKVTAKTFEKKFIAFYPANKTHFVSFKPSALFFDFSVNESPASFQGIKNIYTDESNLWPSLITGYKNRGSSESPSTPEHNVKITHGIALLLKGTPFILYGDEISLKTIDNQRLMKWDSSSNCGFSTSESVKSELCNKNVEEELSDGAGNTLIRMYKQLIELRQKSSFLFGKVKLADSENSHILAFAREANNFDGYIVAANIGSTQKTYNLKAALGVPDKAVVVYFDWFDKKNNNDFELKKSVSTERILLQPGEFLILSFTR